MHSDNDEWTVKGIKTALSVVEHDPIQIGFCSLRTITFDQHGEPTVTNLVLTKEEAEDVRYALADLLDRRNRYERERMKPAVQG